MMKVRLSALALSPSLLCSHVMVLRPYYVDVVLIEECIRAERMCTVKEANLHMNKHLINALVHRNLLESLEFCERKRLQRALHCMSSPN